MKLVCFVEKWFERHPDPESERRFLAETRIKPRMLRNLRRGDVKWRLDRDQIEALMLFGYRNGISEIFEIRHHPLWATFHSAPALLYRGAPIWDAPIEVELSRIIAQMNGRPTSVTSDQTEAQVERAMKETNCVFVGSPKSNLATEIAICLMANARPFVNHRANRQKVPVHMLVDRPPAPSAIMVGGKPYGFDILKKDGSREHLGAHWLPPKEYATWHSEGEDSAVILICRSPLGTKKDVTTIVVMGYSGLATQSAMFQLIKGHVPPLPPEPELRSGELHILGYHFQFVKLKQGSRNMIDPRRVVEKTITWWPPKGSKT